MRGYKNFRYMGIRFGIFLALFFIFSCENREVSLGYSMEEVEMSSFAHKFHVLEIDGCHYLFLELDRNNPHEGFGFFAHRGNCPNPIHKYNEDALRENPISPLSVISGRVLDTLSAP